MGFRLNRRIKLGKGLRLNLGTKGLSISVGRPGAWYTVHTSGRTTQTIGLPGTGVSYRTQGRLPGTAKGDRRAGDPRAASKPPTTVPMHEIRTPKAGVFSPSDERAFVRGVGAYQRQDYTAALAAFRESMERDPSNEHVGEEYLAALCCVALGNSDDAVDLLERVIASAQPLPDHLMKEYAVEGTANIPITPRVVVGLPAGHLAAALLLVEVLQEIGRTDRAAQVLESLGSVEPDPLFALSLADLYAQLGRWDDLLRVTDEFLRNTDDVTAQILVYRARGLREKELYDVALDTLKEALRSRKRPPEILEQAREERALTRAAAGDKRR